MQQIRKGVEPPKTRRGLRPQPNIRILNRSKQSQQRLKRLSVLSVNLLFNENARIVRNVIACSSKDQKNMSVQRWMGRAPQSGSQWLGAPNRGLRRLTLEMLEDRRLLAVLDVGVGARYATIQSAVDAARPGDVVLVGDGQYAESVNLSRMGIVTRRLDRRPDHPRPVPRRDDSAPHGASGVFQLGGV